MSVEKVASIEACDCGEIYGDKYKVTVNGKELILCEKCIQELCIKLFDALTTETEIAA